MLWIAVVRETEQNPTEAEAMYRSAMAAQQPNSADHATTLELYARFLREQGRDDEAKVQLDLAASTRGALALERHGPVQAGPNVFKVGLGEGQRLLLTVKPEAAMKQKRELKPGEFADLLKSDKVSGLHLDTLSGDIRTVPDTKLGRGGMK